MLVLEWVDPPYVAGHWVPELVELAGGKDVAGAPGEPSRQRSWADLTALQPDLVLVALCGFDAARARVELDAVSAGRVLHQGPVRRHGQSGRRCRKPMRPKRRLSMRRLPNCPPPLPTQAPEWQRLHPPQAREGRNGAAKLS